MAENVRGRLRVLHVITSLGQGGAETVLFRVVAATAADVTHAVVSLHVEGHFAEPLRTLGAEVHSLGMPRGRVTLAGFRRLKEIIRLFHPDVIQSRLHHSNLLASFAAKFTGGIPVIWAVHSTYLGAFRATWKTRLVRRLCAWISHSMPRAIISDARSGALLHAQLGFAAEKFSVIYNGVDCDVFKPDAQARERLRAAWGVTRDECLFGCVARWDPLKDHDNLLAALAHTGESGAKFRCVLVGTGMTPENALLAALIQRHGVAHRVIAVGPSGEISAVMAGLDVLVMSSLSESMPVSVVEAMSCAVPCVVTDVGDSAAIVEDTGWVVPPRDSPALAAALLAASAGHASGANASRAAASRARVASQFSLARMQASYVNAWRRAAAEGSR